MFVTLLTSGTPELLALQAIELDPKTLLSTGAVSSLPSLLSNLGQVGLAILCSFQDFPQTIPLATQVGPLMAVPSSASEGAYGQEQRTSPAVGTELKAENIRH